VLPDSSDGPQTGRTNFRGRLIAPLLDACARRREVPHPPKKTSDLYFRYHRLVLTCRCRCSLLSRKALKRMGGLFREPPAIGDLLVSIRIKIAGARVVCSMVPEVAGDRDIARINAPWELTDVAFAAVRASFAVADTGSVLLSDAGLCVNALAYLAQHLIVLLDPIDLPSVRSDRCDDFVTAAHFFAPRFA
jgi:hypothetical protein